MNIKSEFKNYAVKHCGIPSLKVEDYENSMTPYIWKKENYGQLKWIYFPD